MCWIVYVYIYYFCISNNFTSCTKITLCTLLSAPARQIPGNRRARHPTAAQPLIRKQDQLISRKDVSCSQLHISPRDNVNSSLLPGSCRHGNVGLGGRIPESTWLSFSVSVRCVCCANTLLSFSLFTTSTHTHKRSIAGCYIQHRYALFCFINTANSVSDVPCASGQLSQEKAGRRHSSVTSNYVILIPTTKQPISKCEMRDEKWR